MPAVWIPASLRRFAEEREHLELPGDTVADLVHGLDKRYPDLAARLVQGDMLRPGLAVVVDGQVSRRGLAESVGPTSEVHFVAALAGG